MTTCTRRIQFCAGHRVMGHENKCAHLHGHNYVALVTAEAEKLDAVGRVIDFGVLKEKIGGWIDRKWDHGFIVNERDCDVIRMFERFNPREATGQKLFAMEGNPTAEVMADYLLHSVCPTVLAGTGVRVVRVQLWETENCYAEVAL